MPACLLDTSVYSQPLRRRPVVQALKRWDTLGDAQCMVSVVSVAEVEFGLHLEASQNRRLRMGRLVELNAEHVTDR